MASCTPIWMGRSPASRLHHRTTTPHPFIPLAQAHLPCLESTSTMSEYNNAFDFNAIAAAYDMPAPVMDQSGTWNAALHPQSGLMEGGTAAQPHARLDLAPFEGARSNG